MKTLYVFPGTFSPPTLGHLNIVNQAATMFPEIIILCSENPEKTTSWFSPEECRKLWLSYRLPKNATVTTLAEFQPQLNAKDEIVMIRGLRDEKDFALEQQVLLYNHQKFGISKYCYIFGSNGYRKISSSLARQEATALDWDNFSEQLSPLVISAMLEKALKVQNIFLVVGQPGSGKSTFLKMLAETDPRNFTINTDDFNHQLRPLLKAKFGQEDLIKVALENETEMKKVIAKSWLELLKESLKSAPAGANVFVEIPYGLQADKALWRFIGGKVIYIGCDDENLNLERLKNRGTPELAKFIEKIPDRSATAKIARQHRLQVGYINTDCPLGNLKDKATNLNALIWGGSGHAHHL